MDFERLIQQPESSRDGQWELMFLDQFPSLLVRVEGEQAKAGPDGWPYLQVRTGPGGAEPALEILRWLAGRGIGLVVNAHKMMPDYVFTYGMIWNYVETGRFTGDGRQAAEPQAEVTYSGDSVMGPPSEKYLPGYVRSTLREFLKAQGFSSPKILVVSSRDFKQVDLLFSIESLGNLAQTEHRVFAEMMSWFLPQHYALVMASEKGLPEFTAL